MQSPTSQEFRWINWIDTNVGLRIKAAYSGGMTKHGDGVTSTAPANKLHASIHRSELKLDTMKSHAPWLPKQELE